LSTFLKEGRDIKKGHYKESLMGGSRWPSLLLSLVSDGFASFSICRIRVDIVGLQIATILSEERVYRTV
jgi:hypothetical protein